MTFVIWKMAAREVFLNLVNTHFFLFKQRLKSTVNFTLKSGVLPYKGYVYRSEEMIKSTSQMIGLGHNAFCITSCKQLRSYILSIIKSRPLLKHQTAGVSHDLNMEFLSFDYRDHTCIFMHLHSPREEAV